MNDVLYLPSMGQNLMEDSKEVSQTFGQTPVVGGASYSTTYQACGFEQVM